MGSLCFCRCRLNVRVRALTQGCGSNYDVQFIVDYHALVEYLVKYKTKPEKRSDTYKELMKLAASEADPTGDSVQKVFAQMLNVLSGRDYGDVETAHLNNRLEIMEWSVVFSRNYYHDGRKALRNGRAGEEADGNSADQPAFTTAMRTWYVQRPAELESMPSFTLLAWYQADEGKYTKIDHGPPKMPCYVPFLEHRHSVMPEGGARAGAQASNKRQHEQYCLQRLEMFKPFRDTAELARGHPTAASALQAWLREPPDMDTPYGMYEERGREVVRFEMEPTRHRLEIRVL